MLGVTLFTVNVSLVASLSSSVTVMVMVTVTVYVPLSP